jgi:hypothetical protein
LFVSHPPHHPSPHPYSHPPPPPPLPHHSLAPPHPFPFLPPFVSPARRAGANCSSAFPIRASAFHSLQPLPRTTSLAHTLHLRPHHHPHASILPGVDGQSAFLNLGSGPSSYSLGVNPDGFFSISHQGKDIMSASASGIETPNLLAGTVSAFDLVLSGVPQ